MRPSAAAGVTRTGTEEEDLAVAGRCALVAADALVEGRLGCVADMGGLRERGWGGASRGHDGIEAAAVNSRAH
jgi:hypothetical protein